MLKLEKHCLVEKLLKDYGNKVLYLFIFYS